MSKESVNQKTTMTDEVATTEKRRATIPEVIKHQKSFEKRYSNIIQKQILETSINMEALQRQMHAFLSFSKSPPKNLESGTSQTSVSTNLSTENLSKAAETEDAPSTTRTAKASEKLAADKEFDDKKLRKQSSVSAPKKITEKRFEKTNTMDIADRGVNKKK